MRHLPDPYRFERGEKTVVWVLAGLTVFAHLWNLGLMPLIADEPIRATVTLEMMLSGNYAVPTVFGDFYYKKPPLYNWLIALFFWLSESWSVFVFRLPSALPLLAFGVAIWRVSRHYITEKGALLAAFAFVLSGRLLTRDSMLGHIDIFYSLTTFLGFYTVFHFWKKGQYWPLFLLSYALAAAGVLMKGLPSFLFQGLTLLAWFLYNRQFRKLFHPAHFAGMALFALLVGGYFYWYSTFHSLGDYFHALYDQSAQRTVLQRKWYEGIIGLLTFPFENFGHLFPTSLFLFYCFRRGIVREWMKDSFLAFTAVVLVVNIIPYWVSPGYFPRYLFMLYPLVFILAGWSVFRNSGLRTWLRAVVEYLFLIMGCILLPAFSAVFFIPEVWQMDHALSWAVVLIILVGLSLWLWFRKKEFRLWWSLFFLVLFRIGFDVFVIPYRVQVEHDFPVLRKEQAAEMLAIAGDTPIRVLDDVPLNIDFAFYLGRAQQRIIQMTGDMEPGIYYIAVPSVAERYDVEVVYRFPIAFENRTLWMVRLR